MTLFDQVKREIEIKKKESEAHYQQVREERHKEVVELAREADYMCDGRRNKKNFRGLNK